MALEIKGLEGDNSVISLGEGNQIRRGDLRQLYESIGVRFSDDGRAILALGEGSAIRSIELDEKMLFAPQPSDWQTFKNQVENAFGNQIELFDPIDKAHEYTLRGTRYRNLGRIYHHEEWVCCPVKRRVYYTYLQLEGSAQLSEASWQQIAKYVVCVVAAVGLTVLLSLLPGGKIILLNFMGIVTVIAAGCLALVSGISNTAKQQAWIVKYVAR